MKKLSDKTEIWNALQSKRTIKEVCATLGKTVDSKFIKAAIVDIAIEKNMMSLVPTLIGNLLLGTAGGKTLSQTINVNKTGVTITKARFGENGPQWGEKMTMKEMDVRGHGKGWFLQKAEKQKSILIIGL